MYHEAHIGLVYAHAESDSGHNHIDTFHEEIVLRFGSGHRVETSMIGCGFDIVSPQHLGQLFHFFAREAINDAALARVLLDVHDDLLLHILGFGAHFVVEIRAVERAFKLFGLEYAETFLDVGAHLIGGSGSQRNNGGIAYAVDGGADVAVFRTEIVAPFGYTVGLVDGVERDFHFLEQFYVFVLVERFGSHIEQFCFSGEHIVHHFTNGLFGERRVEIMGYTVVSAHSVDHIHLILHQCDERRYDHGSAFHDERRQLIAEAFASAGGHKHKGVVAVQQVADDGLLVAFEMVETEMFF